MLDGFNSIGDRQVYWRVCEDRCLKSTHKQQYKDLIEPLANLYSYIIEYQARVICHLSISQPSRAWRAVINSNEWALKIQKIDELDKECNRFINVGEQEEIRKNWDKQLQEMQNSRIIQEDILRTMKENIRIEREAKLLQHLANAAGNYERKKTRTRRGFPAHASGS
jgi:hypothetical protein